MNHSSVFQRTADFAKDFLNEASHAKERIWIQVMFFDPGVVTRGFENALLEGARRGLDVRLHVDWVTNKYFGGDLLLLPPLQKEKRAYYHHVNQERKEMFTRLTSAGVTIVFTNIPLPYKSRLPMLGRNHTKIFIVDDTAVWIGGVNIAEIMFTNEDFMVKSYETSLIKATSEQFLKINDDTPRQDYHVQCDPTHTLIVDAGLSGKSLILSETLRGIESAKKEIIFMSQLAPDGNMRSLIIKKAKEGVKVTVITSPKTDTMVAKFPYNITFILFRLMTVLIPNVTVYHYPVKVHSKLVLIDDEIAFFGSHNFVFTGVLFGTQEICIRTTEKKLIATFSEYTATSISSSIQA